MRKHLFTQAFLIICFFSSYSIPSTAQSDPNNDTTLIADQVKFLGKDSVKFYLTDYYWLSPAACAKYYMIAKVNRYFQLEGLVKYYYVSDNKIAGEANYRDGHLFGLSYSFYPDGNIQSEGFYYDNQQAGEWDYFYDKNRKWKVINFSEKGPLLEEFYKKNGKQMVKDGSGKFEGNINDTYSYNVGDVKNGLMDGKWVLQYRFNYRQETLGSIEFYSEGRFIKGILNSVAFQGQEYTTNPKCTFIDENKLPHLDYYSMRFSGCVYRNGYLYANAGIFEIDNFFPEFEEKLTNVLKDYKKQDSGWVCIKYCLTNRDKIKDVRTYSIINDNELMEKISHIVMGISRKNNDTVSNDEKKEMTETSLFYLLIENKSFIIPAYALSKSRTPDWLKNAFKKHQ